MNAYAINLKFGPTQLSNDWPFTWHKVNVTARSKMCS